LRKYLPNSRFASSHEYKGSELLMKQAAASTRKGVVGITGRNNPMMPRASESKPTTINSPRTILFLAGDSLRFADASPGSTDALMVTTLPRLTALFQISANRGSS
jgi:hypothetical protein